MKKVIVIAALLIIAVAMAMTVPEKAAHKEAMMEAVKAYVDEEAADCGLGDNVLTNLGKNIVNKTIEVALNSKLTVNNYLLFNTTSVALSDEQKTLSVGLLGHVFTFDKEMLRDALESAAREKAEQKNERKVAREAEKEARRLEKQLEKEQRKREKEARREQKRLEKEARREQKRLEKEARKNNTNNKE